MRRALTLRPFAKVNLMLRVGARQPDGYHEVRTVLQAVGLFDALTFTARRGPFALQSRAPGLPMDDTNLVWRAAAALWRAAGKSGAPRDAHVKLDKAIPMGAGLGGGSADAAAALVGLNQLWDFRCPPHQLIRLARELGADVPFFLQGGTAFGAGRGDEIYPVDDITRFGVVVIKPSFGIATADAYSWLDADRASATEGQLREPRALDVGWAGHPLTIANDLEAPVARRHPAIEEMIAACMREGAVAAAMTGSGSAVFGLFREAVASKAARKLRRPDWLILLTRTLSRRESGRRMTL
jgi:4-diphosphocytidyl-2-C-methyl-D-erythritol kinase